MKEASWGWKNKSQHFSEFIFLNDVAQDIWQRTNIGQNLWWPRFSQKQRPMVYFKDGFNELRRINYCILKITFPAAHPWFQHLTCCWSDILIIQFKTTVVVVIFFWRNKLRKMQGLTFYFKKDCNFLSFLLIRTDVLETERKFCVHLSNLYCLRLVVFSFSMVKVSCLRRLLKGTGSLFLEQERKTAGQGE